MNIKYDLRCSPDLEEVETLETAKVEPITTYLRGNTEYDAPLF